MPVLVAEKAGFCSGVKRAVDLIIAESKRSGCGSTLGPLVHNEEVTAFLEEHSVYTVGSLQQARGTFLAIRTHGVSPDVIEELKTGKIAKLIDLTCPRVKKVQKIAASLKEKGFYVLILGNSEHPEVKGLLGWAGERSQVVSSIDEIESIITEQPAALIAQTTANRDFFGQAVEAFKNKFNEGIVYDTLCPETELREKEAVRLSEKVEAFIVVGSASSANTIALYERCRQLKPTCLAANGRELDSAFLRQHKVIGITAGASTPPWMIKEVVEKMENEKVEAEKEEKFDFAGEIKVPQVGEEISGKVARVTDEEVYVDIGAKTEAILPAGEVHLSGDAKLGDLFAPEDDIEVTVIEAEDQEGKVIVSHRRLDRERRLQELEKAIQEEKIISGKVKQVVGAGIIIDLGSGVEGFMPGSLVDTSYIPDFNEFKDREIEFKIIESDPEKSKLILSRKAILEEEKARIRENTLGAIEAGSTISGVVKRLTNFGAFVDVGGIDGLVHISELSWERVENPSEVLAVGDEIRVKVLDVSPENERISLSIRQTQPDPWEQKVEKLVTGELISGRVTRLVDFGAFVELLPGVEGLAHISQLADYHVKHPSEILREGEVIEVKIIEIKPKTKKISLSIKETRGVMVVQDGGDLQSGDSSNVTLGDLFGNLFDKGETLTDEEKNKSEDESDDNTLNGN